MNPGQLYVAASMADLKAFGAPVQDTVVSLAGYYTVNDGGGGLFYWDSSATEAGNQGTVIAPGSNPVTGRWRRTLTDKDLNVKWFGAKGDGINDDTAAIQQAIGSLPARGGTVYFPGGIYSITSTITVGNGDAGTNFSTRNGVKLVGEGGAFGVDDPNMRPTVLMCNAAMPAAIDVRGRISDVHIENFHIRCISNAGVGIKLTAVSGTQMRNVKILHYTQIGLFIMGGNAPVGNYNVFNEFDNVNVASIHDNSICLYMDGNYAVQNDTWITSWRNCRFDTVNSKNSVCAWFKFVDSNSFYRCHFACYDASSTGVIFDATANHSFPAGMAFYDCSIYNTVVYENETNKIRKNYFYGHGTYDNEVVPTHLNLIGFTDDGRWFNMNLQPLSTTAAGENGSVQWINKGLNEAVTLPAGGKWEYDIMLVNQPAGTFNRVGGIAPGGSVVNNTANANKLAKIKRLSD